MEILGTLVSVRRMSRTYTALFQNIITKPKPIPGEVLESLYQYLCKLTRGFRLITTGNEAKLPLR